MKNWISILFFVILTIAISHSSPTNNEIKSRSFVVDWDNNRFLKDGEPFQFIGGSFHYFRAVPEKWRHILRTMRAGGLNVVTTYVEWSLHNPKDGEYTWEGMADLDRFIEIAAEEDLFVILRPGPYICAERDMGGFPYWLLHKYPNIKLRTSDSIYLEEVTKWYDILMPRMDKYLYGNGGPIIMVQVENEYGALLINDKKYMIWLNDLTKHYVQDKAVLFTNDNPILNIRSHIKGVLATLDFGPGHEKVIDAHWGLLRLTMPKGPLVNIEYYPGWYTPWHAEKMSRRPTEPVTDSLRYMLQQNASVNIYMMYGGTNFGFTAGANGGGPAKLSYVVDVTSYDYDAPIDEAGDITPKYLAIRDVIGEFFKLPDIPIPEKSTKVKFGPIVLKRVSDLLTDHTRNQLNTGIVKNEKVMSFEALDQYSGLVLYETELPDLDYFGVDLKFKDVHDRAYVFVNQRPVGILSRREGIRKVLIMKGMGTKLQIFTENQGRINFLIPNDFKGLFGKVMYHDVELKNWTMTKFPLDNVDDMEKLIEQNSNETTLNSEQYIGEANFIPPTIHHASFNLTTDKLHDTYLNPTGWGKGVAYINGFNLGRYWPTVGPQITLFVPGSLLKEGKNDLIIIEYEQVPETLSVTFDDHYNLGG